ncbi:MAG: DNA polymerase III subunit delta [Desulfovibrionaceae bacterium]
MTATASSAARPGFSFFVCPDAELIKARINELAAAHPPEGGAMGGGLMGGGLEGGAGAPAWERHVFWGDEGLSPRFWECLTLTGLLGKPKLVVVRNAHALAAADWKELAATLNRPNAGAWPMFCLEKEFDRGKAKIPAHVTKLPFWTFAKKKKWIWESPGLSPQSIAEHVRGWARAKGFAFAPGGLEAIAAALPPDATAIARELDKLELALGPDGLVTPEMAGLITFSTDLDIFAFLAALQSGNAPAQVWRTVLSSDGPSGEMLFPFLSNLAREARIMWQLLHGDNDAVRLPPYVAKNKQALAGRLGPQGLARIWDMAMQADLGVKSGERKPDQALEILVAGLAELFGGTTQRGVHASRR